MGRKKKILAGICVLCLLVLNVLIVCHRGSVGGNYELHLTMNSDKEQEIQVYYSAAGELSEKSSQVKTYDQVGESQELQQTNTAAKACRNTLFCAVWRPCRSARNCNTS